MSGFDKGSEGFPISVLMLMRKAKQFHDEMEIPRKCDYSQGWLHWFNIGGGIHQLMAGGEQLSASRETAENM